MQRQLSTTVSGHSLLPAKSKNLSLLGVSPNTDAGAVVQCKSCGEYRDGFAYSGTEEAGDPRDDGVSGT